MSKRPTPETDAIRFYLKTRTTYDLTDFEIWENHSAKLERERDEARELNAKLFALADRATDDLRWFYESHADGISSELEKLKEAVK